MNAQERQRLVDSALDRALGPQLVEPRAGLEERILANLPKQMERRPWWQWMWIPALAAAAVLTIAIGMKLGHRETPAPVQANKAPVSTKPEVAVKPEVGIAPAVQPRVVATRTKPRVSPLPTRAVVAKAEPLPRMNVFPAPSSLTDQERLLLALSRRQRGEVEIAAVTQSAERERAQKFFETGYAPESAPSALEKK